MTLRIVSTRRKKSICSTEMWEVHFLHKVLVTRTIILFWAMNMKSKSQVSLIRFLSFLFTVLSFAYTHHFLKFFLCEKVFVKFCLPIISAFIWVACGVLKLLTLLLFLNCIWKHLSWLLIEWTEWYNITITSKSLWLGCFTLGSCVFQLIHNNNL